MESRLFTPAIIFAFTISSSAQALVVNPSTDAEAMANEILGLGVSLVTGSANYIGDATQSGFFTDGGTNQNTNIGIESGVLLTTGDINDVPGPNTSLTTSNSPPTETRGGEGFQDDDINTDIGGPGDADLDADSGFSTNDAAVLEFDFIFDDVGGEGNVFIQFVFGSEEYIDYIGTEFNDIFGFYLDGINIAVVPGTSDPITINTVNDANNSSFYRNNVLDTDGVIPLTSIELVDAVSFDGLTTVLTASFLGLNTSVAHTMKFAVADATDGLLDAGVFLKTGSFSTTDPNIPEPTTLALLSLGLVGIGFARKKKL